MMARPRLTKKLCELEAYAERKHRLAAKMGRTIGALLVCEAAYVGLMRLGGMSVLTPDLMAVVGIAAVWLGIVGVGARRDAREADGEISQLRRMLTE